MKRCWRFPLPAGPAGRKRSLFFRSVKNKMKYLAFGSLAVLLILLAAATVLEKRLGTPFVSERIYGAGWFVALWGLTALSAAGWIALRRRNLRPAAMLLHASLLLILAGGLCTWLFGERGTVRLRAGGKFEASFEDDAGVRHPLPFGMGLAEFRIVCYPGTRAAADYESDLSIAYAGDTLPERVSMNRILCKQGYRIYQSGFDGDAKGTVLTVSHDPRGIALTYAGYALFTLSVLSLPWDRRSRLRSGLLRRLERRAAFVGILLAAAVPIEAAETDLPVLPREVADRLGTLHVCYRDRICPLSTLAGEFTLKLTGSRSWRGFTPEQVLSGWLFYYDDWKREPLIRVRGDDARRLLHAQGRFVRLVDFRGEGGGYRLEGAAGSGVRETDERFGIVSGIASGGALRLFPYLDPTDGEVVWAAPTDNLPRGLNAEQRLFIRRAMNYVNELVVRRDWARLVEVLGKIRAYQVREGGASIPSEGRFRAERLYTRIARTLPVACCLLLAGIAAFAEAYRRTVRRDGVGGPLHAAVLVVAAFAFAFLSCTIALRGYVSQRWPLSDGFEAMQFMAWGVLLLTFLFMWKFAWLLPYGCLVAGLASAVSAMGEANPPISPLQPVLRSPLLSAHVMCVMVAYALLALLACNGVAGRILGARDTAAARRLMAAGRTMLYPALFFLAAGIFLGSVWANVSWGRYWGWDPKEVWALITLLLYALPLHDGSLPAFRRPTFFHTYCAAAFLSVPVTYFGVNCLLGGMHAYAG